MSAPLYPRILLKLSGEVLRSPAGTDCIDSAILADMAEKIEAVRATGVQVAIVIGGGNIFRGLSGTGKGVPRAHGDNMGMLATMINSLALQAALATRDVPAVVLSSRAMPAICELFTFQRARALLAAGSVDILGGGSGNPFFTTDSAAALRAAEVGASLLVKATKVDGIYTADPTAFSLCQDNAIPIMVLNFFQPGALLAALSGDTTVATLVTEEGKS